MPCVVRPAPRQVGEGRRGGHADPKGKGASHTCAPNQAPHPLQPGSCGRGGAWQEWGGASSLPSNRTEPSHSLPVWCTHSSVSIPREILQRYTVSVAVSGFTLRKPPFTIKVQVAQSCPTLCNPMDYTVHGVLQARIPEWVAFTSSRASSHPRGRTQVSRTAGVFFTS